MIHIGLRLLVRAVAATVACHLGLDSSQPELRELKRIRDVSLVDLQFGETDATFHFDWPSARGAEHW